MNEIPIFIDEQALPPQIGELTYAGCQIYDNARAGAKIRYERDLTKADIYLYNLGSASVPADIRNDLVTQAFQQSCSEIFTLEQMGAYLDVELRLSQYLDFSEDGMHPAYLWAAFRYREAPGPGVDCLDFRFSHVFLRTDGGYFNKVRYTYPESEAANSSERMMLFLLNWLDVIPRTETSV